MAQKPSKNFLSLLSQTEGQIIKRKDLVELAQEVFSLSKFKADGLVDRSIYLLKKNGILSPEGDHNNRGYIFQQEKLEEIRARFRDAIPCTLTSEKRVLENELHLTEYEIEAYGDLLLKIPQQKGKIIELQKIATEKLNQLNGKLRAINQLILFQ